MNTNIKTAEDIANHYDIHRLSIFLHNEENSNPKFGRLEDFGRTERVSFDYLERVLLTYDTVEDVIKELHKDDGEG